MPSEDEVFNIVIAPAANDKMAEHFEFLARVGQDAASRLLDELIGDIRSLQAMPHRNPTYERPYVQPGKYRYLLCAKRYRVVYQIVDDTVFVDDIQDTRQSEDKDALHLKRRPK